MAQLFVRSEATVLHCTAHQGAGSNERPDQPQWVRRGPTSLRGQWEWPTITRQELARTHQAGLGQSPCSAHSENREAGRVLGKTQTCFSEQAWGDDRTHNTLDAPAWDKTSVSPSSLSSIRHKTRSQRKVGLARGGWHLASSGVLLVGCTSVGNILYCHSVVGSSGAMKSS